MSEHLDFADHVWGDHEPRPDDRAPDPWWAGMAHWHLLQAVKELKEQVEALEARFNLFLETNNLWDGS